jgi:hypothetical protein
VVVAFALVLPSPFCCHPSPQAEDLLLLLSLPVPLFVIPQRSGGICFVFAKSTAR